MKQPMIATKRFEHAGRMLNPDDQFEADSRYVRVLEATRKARKAPSLGKTAAASADSATGDDLTTRSARRRYRRRDMRAEDVDSSSSEAEVPE